MPTNASSAGRNQGPGNIIDRRVGLEASAEANAQRGAKWQIVREGNVLQMQACYAEQEASGNIARGPEESDFNPDDLESPDALDADIDLSDEDEVRVDDIDRDTDVLGGACIFSDHLDEGDSSQLTMGAKYELLVVGGRCMMQRPRWMRARALNKEGEEFLDEVGGRMGILGAVGHWLAEKRSAFLKEPNPWHLGVDALNELEMGSPSITEDGLLKVMGIKTSLLNRYKKECFLVWEDAILPLDFLISQEAKAAWVARALIQRNLNNNDPFTQDTLDRIKDLASPKDKRDKNSLLAEDVDTLSLSHFIQRASLVAGVAWSVVLQNYEEEIVNNKK